MPDTKSSHKVLNMMVAVHKLAGKLAGKVGGQYTNFSVHFKCKIWFMVSTIHQTVKFVFAKSHLTTGVWGSSSDLLPKGTNSFHVLPSYVICCSDHNSALSCADVLWCALSRVDVIWWQGLYDIHIMVGRLDETHARPEHFTLVYTLQVYNM